MFDSLIAPAARRFRPDIILVSAGFDAHWRDPFQQLQFRCGAGVGREGGAGGRRSGGQRPVSCPSHGGRQEGTAWASQPAPHLPPEPPACAACRSSTYHKLAVRLRQLAAALCGGRLVFLLEGGYHTEAVGESVCEVFLALLGRRSVEGQAALELPHEEPVGEVGELVAQLRGIHGL